MKITEYWLVTAIECDELGEEVQGFISEGWQPFGSPTHTVVVLKDGPGDWYTQAVVKYAPEPTTGHTATFGPMPLPPGPLAAPLAPKFGPPKRVTRP